MNILTIPVTILFFIIGGQYLYYTFKLRKAFHKKHNILTSYATFILWLTAGLLYPLLYPNNLLMQSLSSIIIMLVVPLIFIIVLSIQRNAIKKNPLLMDKRGIKSFVSLFKQKENVLNKPYHDLMRKLFHAIPSLMIMIIWVTCSIIGQPELRMPLILTTGYAGLTAFAFLDFIRLSFINNKKVNHLLPDSINKLLARVIKEQELYEPLKVAPLILAMIPILFFPFPVFFSMMLIATISDGMASVTGHYFGKKKFPANSNKTIVGYFAGAITSFILVIISFSLLSTLLINKIILIGLVGTAAFFITDFVNMRIDDNILNPLISGLVIGLTYLFS
ncbi:MAG: hypothetical protein WC307_05805 [Candidatus Nanoarchaeia archaeon]